MSHPLPQARPGYLCLGVLLTLAMGRAHAAEPVSQLPLSVGDQVPGNLLLVPSVEWPTLDSMANLGDYDANRVYVGYFDARKCYKYFYSATETERHFYPFTTTLTGTCAAGNQLWSGNYLNWVATQTIDPFRKALTGGYRVKDTPTETWLEKARYDGENADYIYPDRRVPGGSAFDPAAVASVTPMYWDRILVRVRKAGNKMLVGSSGISNPVVAYDPAATLDATKTYQLSVRVKVCDPSVGLESNCKRYSDGYKPEGLIQEFAGTIRYSVFGYLNDHDTLRDGGVLRANQKFVGAEKLDPASHKFVPNPNQEWDPVTGVLVRNPDPVDAANTTATVGKDINDSGVINYINKFGQMTTKDHKRYDPVSELYYTAIRYLKHQGNVASYANLNGSADENYEFADGFPVITAWNDPIQYWCQTNAILGIGDVYSHKDKNLPGNSAYRGNEPAVPPEVSADTTINVVTATQKVAALEGITINPAGQFTNFENSAYIAGLAYDSHTQDLRPGPELIEKQTVSTYWVDVREKQVLEKRARNQYWLAAKYGGFTVPEGYDPYANTTPLATSLWNASGETLSNGDLRPDNFYVASEADKMVESLSLAFAKIVAEAAGSASSLAANATRLDTETRTFQAKFFSGTWHGDLQAYVVESDGSLPSTPLWQASIKLAAAAWAARNIYVYNPQRFGTARYDKFEWDNLGAAQRAALGSKEVVDYLRGDRSKERSQPQGTLRTRTTILGDIVNSAPTYVGKPNPRLYAGATFSGAGSYGTFANSKANRTGVVYAGANDGMLHGFNAATGVEIYAFVPSRVIFSGLKQYSDPDYGHRYFVDGEIAVADIYDTTATAWKTVLVGTLGRGGPGAFALDVTDPQNVKFLWEKSGFSIPALGKNIGRPVIAQVADGDWRVLIGNGLGSTDESAALVSIGVMSGAVTVADTGASGSNGLSAVLAHDSDGDGFADIAYAGDLKGNLWKFTALAGNTSSTPIFQAKDPTNAQPITAAPLVGRNPASGTRWVFFGTGSYLGRDDVTDTQRQTWYGLKDTGTVINGRDDLVQRSITATGTIGDFSVRVISAGTTQELAGKRGWYIDLPVAGERMVVPNRFQGAALIGTSRIPDISDVCRPSGKGYVMAIDPFTGGRLEKTFFDANRDGVFDDADKLLGDDGLEIVSAIGFDSGVNNPIFVEDVMQVSRDDGKAETVKIQGSAVDAQRMSWRELLNLAP